MKYNLILLCKTLILIILFHITYSMNCLEFTSKLKELNDNYKNLLIFKYKNGDVVYAKLNHNFYVFFKNDSLFVEFSSCIEYKNHSTIIFSNILNSTLYELDLNKGLESFEYKVSSIHPLSKTRARFARDINNTEKTDENVEKYLAFLIDSFSVNWFNVDDIDIMNDEMNEVILKRIDHVNDQSLVYISKYEDDDFIVKFNGPLDKATVTDSAINGVKRSYNETDKNQSSEHFSQEKSKFNLLKQGGEKKIKLQSSKGLPVLSKDLTIAVQKSDDDEEEQEQSSDHLHHEHTEANMLDLKAIKTKEKIKEHMQNLKKEYSVDFELIKQDISLEDIGYLKNLSERLLNNQYMVLIAGIDSKKNPFYNKLVITRSANPLSKEKFNIDVFSESNLTQMLDVNFDFNKMNNFVSIHTDGFTFIINHYILYRSI